MQYTSHFDKKLNYIYLNIENKLNILFLTHEAIINIYKYGGATLQSIEFYVTILGDTIRFEIIDDGIGFPQNLQLKQDVIELTNDNYERFLVANQIERNGLKSLFEKAKKLNGQLSIHSKTNKTQLTLDFPKFRGSSVAEIV